MSHPRPGQGLGIIVVGAGLAGLAAAGRLARSGHRVTILEARNRIGGRAWTRRDPDGTALELGPEWVAPRGAITELLALTGVEVRPASGRHWTRAGHGYRAMEESPDRTAGLMSRLAGLGGEDRAFSEALNELEDAGDDMGDAEARRLLVSYVEGFHAADPHRLSLRWLLDVEQHNSAGVSDCRVPAGVERALEPLLLDAGGPGAVRLQTIVREIRWQPGTVEVCGVAGIEPVRFGGDAAVITVPLSILKAPAEHPASVRFSPPLPEKAAALAALEMGGAVKVLLRFRLPFWESVGQLADLLFLHDFGQAFPTFWVAGTGRPDIVAWAGGEQAARLGAGSAPMVASRAVASFAAALGLSHDAVDHELVGYEFHDWRSDPFSLGAYSFPGVGGAEAHRALGLPVGNTLFFAGEATAGEGLNATMEGAVRSGWRAADELLATRGNGASSP